MTNKIAGIFHGISYWALIVLPFTMAISIAMMNICMGLLLGSFLIAHILERRLPEKMPALSVVIPFVVFIGVCAFSMVHSLSMRDSMRGIFRFIQYLAVLWVGAASVRDARHLRRVLYACAAGLALASIDAVWQVVYGTDFVRGNAYTENIGLRRATASFADANVLGVYLSALFPITAAFALYDRQGIRRLIAAVSALLGFIGVALTYSRPTILAVFIVLVFFAAVKKDRALGLILSAAVIISPFVLPPSVKAFARSVEYDPLRFMCNDDRIAVYRNSLKMISAHPVTGVGVNTFMKNYHLYKEFPEYRGVVTTDYMYAHNNVLHMLGEVGFLGLAVFLWFLYAVYRKWRGLFRGLKSPFLITASLGFAGALLAFLINGLTESSFYYARVALIFWYPAGVLMGIDEKNTL